MSDSVVDTQPAPKASLYKRAIDSFKPPLDEKSDARVTVVDAEKGEVVDSDGDSSDNVNDDNGGLKRALKGRHLQMIAIGGSIGTGLFVGSGGALGTGGPASLIIGFILIGFMLFNVVMALGELAVTYPVGGSFSIYSTRFIHPAWGFAMGWNYVLQWVVTLPLELVAASITIQYWDQQNRFSPAIWTTIFLIITIIINLFGIRGYGEAEFVYSSIKVIAIVGFIILGIIINAGGAPDHNYYGFKTWYVPGAFQNGFPGFCSVFVTAAFAFSGTELVGLAAAETENPRKSLPSAAKQVFWRITLFYVVSLLLVGTLVSSDNPALLSATSSVDIKASPFVLAIAQAGIPVLPSIFNAVILISVLSVGNSAVFATSRTLTALANYNMAPKVFAYVDREGRPLASVGIVLLFGLIAYIEVNGSATTVFNWLLALSGLSAIFTWQSVCAAHIRFRSAWKHAGRTVEELPFTAALGLYGSWWAVIFCGLVLIAQFYVALFPVYPTAPSPDPTTFFQLYLAAPVVIVFFFFWLAIKRDGFVKLDDVDLDTGRRDFPSLETLRAERAEAKAQPPLKRFYAILC